MVFSISVLLKHDLPLENEDETIWEEDIILCYADCIEEAKSKAEIVARNLEVEYKSLSGEIVKWVYDSILSIYQLEENSVSDGSILFARHLRNREVCSLKEKFSD